MYLVVLSIVFPCERQVSLEADVEENGAKYNAMDEGKRKGRKKRFTSTALELGALNSAYESSR